MDYLWSPWRYTYVSGGSKHSGCIFCEIPRESEDAAHFILFRGRLNFVILNRFPYTSGHLMVVPYAHVALLQDLDVATLQDMMTIAQGAERALRAEYHPEGLNVGMNIGRCAGAGIAEHLHLHMLPRWCADANFMTVVGETRVLPEDLETTYRKLKPHFS